MNGAKRCTRCGEIKPMPLFSAVGDGLHSHCNECRVMARRLYRDGNREAVRAYDRARYRKHHGKNKAAKRRSTARCRLLATTKQVEYVYEIHHRSGVWQTMVLAEWTNTVGTSSGLACSFLA